MSDTSPAELVLLDVSERIATVTLNRPAQRNALSVTLLARLAEVLRDADARDDVDVLILTGADPAFCAGLDLREIGQDGGALTRGTGADGSANADGTRGPFPPISKPIIGAINGAAITGGFELALNCDFLVASERARFGDTHARVGVHPGWGLSVLLPEAIGIRRAREMSFTGNFMDADEALRWGLVNHVVPHEELLPFARALAADIVSADQDAVRALRTTYAETAGAALGDGWDVEASHAKTWQRRGLDPAEVERRRQAVIDRGRAQQS
jgi:enoyl-CoA hydratase